MRNQLLLYQQKNMEQKTMILNYNHDMTNLKMSNEELIKSNNELNYKLETLMIELEKRSNNNHHIEEDLMKIKTDKMALESDLKDMQDKNSKLMKEKDKYKKNLKLFVDENKEAANHIKKLNEELNSIKNKYNEIYHGCFDIGC